MNGARFCDILSIFCDQDKGGGSSEAMRVLFVSANREEINMTTFPLGLACVAEATQRAGLDIIWRGIIYPKAMDEALVKAMAKAG
jgi:hypothetical protein